MAAARFAERMTLEELHNAWNETEEERHPVPLAETEPDVQRFALLVRLGGAVALVAKS